MKFMAAARQLPSDTALAQVFTKHDDELHSGFITRLDRMPVSRKRLFFFYKFIYNLAILSGSVTLAVVLVSQGLACKIPEALRLTFGITQGIILIWAVLVLILSTSIPFFFGECRLRWKHGFKPSEIVVRRLPSESGASSISHEKLWRTSLRAINPDMVVSNPLSLLAPDSDIWIMEHTLILDLYTCIARGELDEEDLEFTAWKETGGVWKGLELWRLQCAFSDQHEVALFKAFLMNKGKYELLSALERLYDNDKTPATQTSENYRSLVKQFSQEGVDYETFWSKIESPCIV